MSIYMVGNTNMYRYGIETKNRSNVDASQKDFVKCLNTKEEEKSSREILQGKIAEMQENIENGDVDHDPVFQIGASEFTEKEWDTLLENYDELQEEIREAIKLEYEKALKESEEEAEIQKRLLEKAEEKERLQKEIDMEEFVNGLKI
ncbi:MAG: hypothetical protein IJO60_11435 [Agathobacter sp.]|nr:hypothetical protein [Agathobacter sp.]